MITFRKNFFVVLSSITELILKIKKRAQCETIILFILIFIIMFSVPLTAGEIFIWKDKNGAENITTAPPPENAKVHDRQKYQPTPQWEIEAYQRQRKSEANRIDRERQANRRASEYEQKIKDIDESYKESNRKREIEWAKEAYDREQETLERYKNYRRRAFTTYGRYLWNDSIKDQEKEVDKARNKLYDLERQ